MTCIILVRHGETDWNREEHSRGRVDVPLNKTGLLQAEATSRRIAAEWHPSAVYASPLLRSLRTAEVIAQYFDLTMQAHAGLTDINFGQWQGLTPLEVRKRWPKVADVWHHAPQRAQIPGGEMLREVSARALEAVYEMSARHAGQTLVMVSHTVVNRVILLAVLGLGIERFRRLQQGTCTVNVFEAEGDHFTLVSLNETYHLCCEAIPE